MGGQRIGAELAAAVRTSAQPLGTVFGTVDGHAATDDTCSALGLAVDRFGTAGSRVLLETDPGEFHIAELADGTTQNAGEGQMIGHHYPRDLRAALVGARDGIMFTGVQVSLVVGKKWQRERNVISGWCLFVSQAAKWHK